MVLSSDYIDWVVAWAFAPSSESNEGTPSATLAERPPHSDLPERLKAAIAPAHTAIEQLPISQALAGGRVSWGEYVSLLQRLWPLHRALEAAFGAAPILEGLYREESMARADSVAGDLAALGVPYDPLTIPDTVTKLIRPAVKSPALLIGYLYVLEGSRMGSLVLLRSVARALNLPIEPGVGLDYHLDGSAQRPRAWQGWKVTLAAHPLTTAEADAVVRGAEQLMQTLIDLYAATTSSIPVESARLP